MNLKLLNYSNFIQNMDEMEDAQEIIIVINIMMKGIIKEFNLEKFKEKDFRTMIIIFIIFGYIENFMFIQE